MTMPDFLRADCAQCAALCCMAPAFDKSSSFAFSKPANAPCPNLNKAGACMIHEDRARLGLGGCVNYDCLGAGQRVTQGVFKGRSWLSEPHLKTRMARAFMMMRQIHDLLALLKAAEALSLTPAERRTLTVLFDTLHPKDGWSEESLSGAPFQELYVRVTGFLQTLKRHVSDQT